MEIALATELTSGAISNILEAVPGIATVLRSPVADAIVNLSRAAAGLIPFDKKDAHELIRYAVRRGLIRSDEGDRVAGEVDAAPNQPRPVAPVPEKKPAKRATHGSHHAPARKKSSHRPHARHPAKKK